MSDYSYVEGKQATTPRNPEYLPRAGGTRCVTLAGEAADYIASHKVWDHQRNGHILPYHNTRNLQEMIERIVRMVFESGESVSEDQANACRILLTTLKEIWGEDWCSPVEYATNEGFATQLTKMQLFSNIVETDPTMLSRLEVSLRNLARSGPTGPRQTAEEPSTKAIKASPSAAKSEALTCDQAAEREESGIIEMARTPIAGTDAASAGNDSGKAERAATSRIALDKDEHRILEVLSKNPTKLYNSYDLESLTHFSRKTIGKKLKRMISAGLVVRPNGPRGGVTVTDTGATLHKSTE